MRKAGGALVGAVAIVMAEGVRVQLVPPYE